MSAYSDLVAAFRTEADDTAEPYLWDAAYILQIAIDAQKEAAERALLIEDDGSEDGNPDLNIEWEAGDRRKALPAWVIQVRSVAWTAQGTTETVFLTGISLEELNESFPRGWASDTSTSPRRFIDPQQKYLTPFPLPSVDGDLNVSVYRRPTPVLEESVPASGTFDTLAFEIAEDHIAGLVHWMLHRAYGKRDSDGYDANLSAKHDGLFTARFGPKYDANALRRQRARTKNVVAFNPTW